MIEQASLQDLSKEDKKLLLKELGYDSDDVFVLDESGEPFLDKYTNQPIKIDSMIIMPGSAVVLDDNPLSLTSYLEENPDVKLF